MYIGRELEKKNLIKFYIIFKAKLINEIITDRSWIYFFIIFIVIFWLPWV